ncbi:VIT domain-containing protein [Aquibium sp. ELW1220]|uniref:VIT domain-containing protein n=1 Tax=Aquibium sp. ELW1220 TaxID=2976766 RepID=UPI0025AF3CE2|nr:VIT domain-containing protein [Aquibium sp. ELW1220]MDN2584284.1 VIT domain-containing protein [Aquibium sp. ELW1220]
MQATALGHHLETLHDGLTTFCEGEPVPVPLTATMIAVRIASGLAIVRTTRSFRNAEANPIEALMTFPVGFDAVVTELVATIDGRRMLGVAKERSEARETYEAALDAGRLSVLHEEALRGIHILSIGALPPGAQVAVELEQAMPLIDVGGVPSLRLPMTAGQLYGSSPLLPSDDLITADGIRHVAGLSITVDAGHAVLHGQTVVPDQPVEILLDRAVEVLVEGGSFGSLSGKAADGSTVSLTIEPVGSGEAALDLHVIVDRSGSTNSPVRDGTSTVWQAMRDGLASELGEMRVTDRVTLWQFDNDCQFLGAARGPACARLVEKLDGPRGGTELAGAIRAALAKGAKDILVLTDGQTWAHMVEDLKGGGLRISAILAGPQSLDANIGHLCALTGGQVQYAPGRDVASALRSAFASLRQVGAAVQGEITEAGPRTMAALRGGVRLRVDWSPPEPGTTTDSDAIGRFAAALALPLLPAAQAEAFARAHSLCTHMTSLVLVDDAGEVTEGFSRMRKVPLMASASMSSSIAACMAPDMAATRREELAAPNMLLARRPIVDAIPRQILSDSEPKSVKYGMDIEGSQASHSVPKKSSQKTMLKRTLDWLRGEERVPDMMLFNGFSWDTHGDTLLAGDLSILSADQRNVVERLAQRVQSAYASANAVGTGIRDSRILALGLIADRSKGRIAERFARRALKGAPPWLLAKA